MIPFAYVQNRKNNVWRKWMCVTPPIFWHPCYWRVCEWGPWGWNIAERRKVIDFSNLRHVIDYSLYYFSCIETRRRDSKQQQCEVKKSSYSWGGLRRELAHFLFNKKTKTKRYIVVLHSPTTKIIRAIFLPYILLTKLVIYSSLCLNNFVVSYS